MKKWISLLILIIVSCSKDKENNNENCIDESLIDITSVCMRYMIQYVDVMVKHILTIVMPQLLVELNHLQKDLVTR